MWLLQRQQVTLPHVGIDFHAGIIQGGSGAAGVKGLACLVGDVAQLALRIALQQMGGGCVRHTCIVPGSPLQAD